MRTTRDRIKVLHPGLKRNEYTDWFSLKCGKLKAYQLSWHGNLAKEKNAAGAGCCTMTWVGGAI